MENIKLNEKDIKGLIKECLVRVLNEATFGNVEGSNYWEPMFDENLKAQIPEETIKKCMANGLIPQELDDAFEITVEQNAYNDEGNGIAPYGGTEGEKRFGGDYEKAKALIGQIKNKELQIAFMDSLEAFCDNLEPDNFNAGIDPRKDF